MTSKTTMSRAAYDEALGVYKEAVRLGRESIAARDRLADLLGGDDDYRRDCFEEAVMDGIYDPTTDGSKYFEDALDLADYAPPGAGA